MTKDSLQAPAARCEALLPRPEHQDQRTRGPCGVSIRGLATAQPSQAIEQDRAAEIAATLVYGDEKQKRAVPALFRRTRVRRRGSVLLESGNGHGPEQSFYPPAASLADRGPTTALRMQRYAAESVPLTATALMNEAGEAYAIATTEREIRGQSEDQASTVTRRKPGHD